jgi:2-keto-4-pentenoate hydratase/2-oxohepta-3-ene-1,7-dioic acid hydratase in catechol pathway
MAEYALLTYSEGNGPRSGIRVGELIVDLLIAGLPYADTQAVLDKWQQSEKQLAQLAADVQDGRSEGFGPALRALDTVQLLAPIRFPRGIFCAAANYTDHMMEMSGRSPPDKSVTRPYFFPKTIGHSVIGTGDTIRLPNCSNAVDWEAEIAVVIGKPTRRVSVANAMQNVAGYTILNDLSLRDHATRNDWNFKFDWFAHKCFDTSAPMGPWIIPSSQIANLYDLSIKLWVDDSLEQDSSTRHMHFNVSELISYLSERLTLMPGDIVSTGTPAGVGHPKKKYLQPGNVITIEIEGIGTLRNPVAEELPH